MSILEICMRRSIIMLIHVSVPVLPGRAGDSRMRANIVMLAICFCSFGSQGKAQQYLTQPQAGRLKPFLAMSECQPIVASVSNVISSEPSSPLISDDWANSADFSDPVHHGTVSRFDGSYDPFQLQLMPDGLLYGSYLAGPRESRLGTAVLSNSSGDDAWDTTLGGRVGIMRLGTVCSQQPEGWQLDVEGAAFPRLNAEHNADVDAADFRVGVPLTWRQGQWQFKAAFYHISSHVGDEFLVRNPSFQRINFSRNAIVLGTGYFASPELRLYAEVDFGFFNDGGSDPWWFQFGFDYAPSQPTGLRGEPFVAANALLREEVGFGGTLTMMTGWAWRADRSGHLFRVGLQYSDGHTSQFEFHDQSEQLLGIGLWYDF